MDELLDLNGKFLNYNNTMTFNRASPRSNVYKVNKNVNSIQEMKFEELENYKDKINRIHSKLMNKKPVSSGGNS